MLWKELEAADLNLVNADPNSTFDWFEASQVKFTPEYEGTITFELTVMDEHGNVSLPDVVVVSVEKDCTDNDNDNYGDGADCLGTDCDDDNPDCWQEGGHLFAQPTPPAKNDPDGDKYGEGLWCLGTDCNEEDPECWLDGDDCCEIKPKGGGCRNIDGTSPWATLLLLSIVSLVIWRRRKDFGVLT